MESLHEEFLGRWEGRVEVLLLPLSFSLFAGVRKLSLLSLLAEGEVYPSMHSSRGCRTVSRTSSGDGCLFLPEPTSPTQSTEKKLTAGKTESVESTMKKTMWSTGQAWNKNAKFKATPYNKEKTERIMRLMPDGCPKGALSGKRGQHENGGVRKAVHNICQK